MNRTRHAYHLLGPTDRPGHANLFIFFKRGNAFKNQQNKRKRTQKPKCPISPVHPSYWILLRPTCWIDTSSDLVRDRVGLTISVQDTRGGWSIQSHARTRSTSTKNDTERRSQGARGYACRHILSSLGRRPIATVTSLIKVSDVNGTQGRSPVRTVYSGDRD
jgi:hypothetical protein